MSDEAPIDAEGATRNKNYSASDHLKHLLKIGYKPDSIIVKNFVEEYSLHSILKEFIQTKKI